MARNWRADNDRFQRQLDKEFQEAAVEAPKDFRNKVMLFLLSAVVDNTPVDTGRAKANWHVTINQPGTKVFKTTDQSGESTKSKAVVQILTAPFADMFLTNNVEYILVLEDGLFDPKNPGPSKDRRRKRKGRVWVKDGFSVQAPRGMVRIALEEAKQVFGLRGID